MEVFMVTVVLVSRFMVVVYLVKGSDSRGCLLLT